VKLDRDPFPIRTAPLVRVDSIDEEHAFLAAYPSPNGPWQVASQAFGTDENGPVDRLRVRSGVAEAATAEVSFAVASFVGSAGRRAGGVVTTEWCDRLMRRALEFAGENPPFHPGSVPRFPVPSARYPGRVDVPLAILAIDNRRRGLYAPARVVTLDHPSGEPVGIGEMPDFDPDEWPPARLGDWPPASATAVDRLRLQGAIARFSACTVRLLDAWRSGEHYPERRDEATEALALLGLLEPSGMLAVYRRLSPRYIAWLGDADTSGEGAVDR